MSKKCRPHQSPSQSHASTGVKKTYGFKCKFCFLGATLHYTLRPVNAGSVSAPEQRHHLPHSLRTPRPKLGICPPRPQPAVRILHRNVLAPVFIPSNEVHAYIVIVAENSHSLVPNAFIISGIYLLPLSYRLHERNIRRCRRGV